MEDQQEDLTSRIKSYIQQDNYKEALLLSRAHSQDKGNPFIKYFVALSYKLLGQLEEALNTFEDFEEEQYQNIDFELKKELLLNMGDIYYAKQLYAKSGEYYVKLLDLEGESQNQFDSEVFNRCITSLMNIGNFKQAQKIGIRGSKKYPDDANIHLQLGKSMKILKNYPEAIKLLEQFIQRTSYPEAKVLLADIYYDSNLFIEAEKLNNEIIAKYKDYHLIGTLNLAKIKFSKLELEEALKLSRKGFAINPDCAHSYYYQGISLYLMGDLQEAIPSIEMACTLDDKQNYYFALSLIIIYIEKGYFTQDSEYFQSSDMYLRRDEEESKLKQVSNCLKDNPIFQYIQALILRLLNQPSQFEKYWIQIFHISPANLTPLSKHPSQDIYDRLDQDTQNLLCLIPQIGFFSGLKSVNQKCEAEIENQKTLLFFQILKAVSIPSTKLKQSKYQEINQMISNINKYQEICSQQFQNTSLQMGQSISFQSKIQDFNITLNVSNLSAQDQSKQKKDKVIEEFQNKFMEISTNIVEFAYSFLKNGFKLSEKISNYNTHYLISVILLSTIELEQFKKIGDCNINDFNLPQKARRIIDLNTIGRGILFMDSLQIALNQLDQKKIKAKLSKKDLLKKELENLNSYKLKEDLFIFKSTSEALAYEYAYKFFTSLLIDNQPSVKYYSYTLYYYQTISQQDQISILNQVFNSVDSYSHKSMKESLIRSQRDESEKCCSIF